MRRSPAIVLLLLLAATCSHGEHGPTARPGPPSDAASASPGSTTTAQVRDAPAIASPAAGCRNSTSPSCGAFRFDPAPDDDRLRVTVTPVPRAPRAGQQVVFTIRASDPDSKHVFAGTYTFGDESRAKIVDEPVQDCPRAYGPWDPTRAAGGSETKTIRHTYERSGTYEAIFTFYARSYTSSDHPWPARPPGDAGGECLDPYASSGKGEATVAVSTP